jgi:hypothetical protein
MTDEPRGAPRAPSMEAVAEVLRLIAHELPPRTLTLREGVELAALRVAGEDSPVLNWMLAAGAFACLWTAARARYQGEPPADLLDTVWARRPLEAALVDSACTVALVGTAWRAAAGNAPALDRVEHGPRQES